MKRIYLLIFSLTTLLNYNNLTAQINITADDLPTVGTELIVKIDKNVPPTTNLGTPSTSSQNWDFSNLTGDTDTISFFDASTHPATTDFPGSTIARQASLESLLGVSLDVLGLPIELPEAVAFYSVTPEGDIYNNGVNIYINVLGFDLGSQSLQAIPPDFYLGPIQLGQTNSSNAHLEKQLEITTGVTATISINLDRTATADAYGNITLPGNAINPVLRIKEDLTATVSANVGILGSIDTTLSLTIYRFMTPGMGYPVVTASTAETETGTIINFIEYNSDQVIGIQNSPTIPNPKIILPTNLITNNNNTPLTIKLQHNQNLNNHTLQIYNLNGQKIITQTQLTDENQINTNTLTPGAYIILWKNEKNQQIAQNKFFILK